MARKNKIDPFDERYFCADPVLEDVAWVDGGQLIEHWHTKCDGKQIPARSDFALEEMPALLPYLTIYYVEREPLRFKCRLIGTIVENYLGGPGQTDRYLDQMKGAEHVAARSEWLVENRRPYLVTGSKLAWSERRDFMHYDVVGLPFADDNRSVDKIMFLTQFY